MLLFGVDQIEKGISNQLGIDIYRIRLLIDNFLKVENSEWFNLKWQNYRR